jgi:transposase
VDQDYTGFGKHRIDKQLGWHVEVVRHPRTWEHGFLGVMDPSALGGFRWITAPSVARRASRGLPRRWAAERIFSRLLRSRRLAHDYERLTSTDETLIYVTMTRLVTGRLARKIRDTLLK